MGFPRCDELDVGKRLQGIRLRYKAMTMISSRWRGFNFGFWISRLHATSLCRQSPPAACSVPKFSNACCFSTTKSQSQGLRAIDDDIYFDRHWLLQFCLWTLHKNAPTPWYYFWVIFLPAWCFILSIEFYYLYYSQMISFSIWVLKLFIMYFFYFCNFPLRALLDFHDACVTFIIIYFSRLPQQSCLMPVNCYAWFLMDKIIAPLRKAY